jgi:hypothetical protein
VAKQLQEPFVRNEPARPIIRPGAFSTVIPLRGKQRHRCDFIDPAAF